MKKPFLATLLLLTSIIPLQSISQVIYGADFEPIVKGLAESLGQNEENMVFTAPLKADAYGYSTGYSYYSISKTTGNVTEGTVSFKKGPFREITNKLIFGDAIYELGIIAGKSDTYKLLKKSISTLEILEEAKVYEHPTEDYSDKKDKVQLYVDAHGLYIKFAFNGKVHKVQRYTLDLELDWEIDLSESLPLENIGDYLKSVHHNQETGHLILAVDLSGAEEYKMFEKRPKAESEIIALIIIDKAGNQKPFIPEFEEPITYSNNDYFYNAERNELTAIYRIHFEVPKSNLGLTWHCGYSYYKWNVENESVIHHEEKRYTYGDIILPNRSSYFVARDAAKDKSMFYNGLNGPEVNQLKDGSFLINYPLHYYSNLKYLVCLNSEGAIKWQDVSDKTGNEFIAAGSVSITSDGSFIEVRDMETGEVVKSVTKEEIASAVDGKVHRHISYPDIYSDKMLVCLKKKGKMYSYAIVDFGK